LSCVLANGESNYSTDNETHKTSSNSNTKPMNIIKFGSADQLSSVTGKMWM